MFIKENFNDEIDGFLHGNCEFLACEINKNYGYQIEALVELEDFEELRELVDINLKDFLKLTYEEHVELLDKFYDKDIYPHANIVHCFNTFEENGAKYYIDARGITSNHEEFFKIYHGSEGFLNLCFKNEEELRSRSFSTYYDWIGDDDFEENTLKYRIIPAKEYVKNHANLFDKNTFLSNIMCIDDKLMLAANKRKSSNHKVLNSIDFIK